MKNVTLETLEQEIKHNNTPESTEKFVVVRNGVRVSDRSYDDKSDDIAALELRCWEKIVVNARDGSTVNLVAYDKKKHRVW